MAATNVLFPVPNARIISGFTTSALLDIPNVVRVDLADKALGVHKVSSQTTHKVVSPPASDDAYKAWEAAFPLGSINPGNKTAPHGGFGFYLHGSSAFYETLKGEKPAEVLMSYEMMFEESWEWQKGGKLPGMCMLMAFARCMWDLSLNLCYTQMVVRVTMPMDAPADAKQTDANASISVLCGGQLTRFLYVGHYSRPTRDNGTGELYAYLPLHKSNTDALLRIPPRSMQHPDYGFSVGRGAWKFTPGKWTAVAERVKMNTVGKADGEIEVYIDGRTVILATGLILRDEGAPDSYVQGMHFQTFFGGIT